MIAFRFKVKAHGPAHHRVQVFVGKDFVHLSLSGELVMQPEEFEAFAKLNNVPAFDADHNLVTVWDVAVGPVLRADDEDEEVR